MMSIILQEVIILCLKQEVWTEKLLVYRFAAIGRNEAADNSKGSGLAAAARSQNSDKFLFADVEVNMIKNDLAVKSDKNIPQ